MSAPADPSRAALAGAAQFFTADQQDQLAVGLGRQLTAALGPAIFVRSTIGGDEGNANVADELTVSSNPL